MSAACIGTNGRGNSPGPIGVSLAKAVGINGTGPGIRTDRRKAKRPIVARGICEVCIYWARSGHSLMVDWGAWVIVAALAGAGNNVFIYRPSTRFDLPACVRQAKDINQRWHHAGIAGFATCNLAEGEGDEPAKTPDVIGAVPKSEGRGG